MEIGHIAVRFPYRFWPKGKAVPKLRSQMGIPEEAILIVTAGLRLGKEISAAWGRLMVDLLNREKEVYWLLIGHDPAQPLPALSAHDRIRAVPPVTDLEAWFAGADIYANPPRLGGGASVAIAMEQGLPIASLADSDGGDKLANLAMTSIEQYFAQLVEWIRVPDTRRKAGEAMKDRFYHDLDISQARASDDLKRAVELTKAIATQRLRG